MRGEKTFFKTLLPLLSTLIPTALAFLPALTNGFVAWDDPAILTNNPYFRGFGPENLRWMFTSFHMGHYMPLTWISFALDHALWGLNPLGYHLTSLILHGANAWLVYLLALRLLSFSADEPLGDSPVRTWSAALAALLFSLHPLRVESVAWATQRRDVLAAFFLLLTILNYIRYTASRGAEQRRAYVFALAFYLLSLLSKSLGMGLPVILLILDAYPLKRWAHQKWWSLLLEKAPLFIMAAVAMFLAASAQIQTHTALSWSDYGFSPRLAQACFGIAFYLSKTFLPAGLAPLYEIPSVISWTAWPIWSSALFAVLATMLFISVRKTWPAGLAAWASYLVLLAPTLGFLQSGPQFAADRYTYLACLGWAFLAAAGFERFWENAGSKNVRTAGILLALLLPLNLGARTWKQCAAWRDTVSLWTEVLRVDPASYIARKNLGLALVHQGLLPEAETLFRSGAALKPERADAHDDLGFVLMQRGTLNEAEYEFTQALNLDPDYPEANNNMGTLLLNQGAHLEAKPYFIRAIDKRPDFAEARANLANILAVEGNVEKAAAEFSRAIQLKPDSAGVRYNFGIFLGRQNRWPEAADQFRRALELHPGWEAAQNALNDAQSRLTKNR